MPSSFTPLHHILKFWPEFGTNQRAQARTVPVQALLCWLHLYSSSGQGLGYLPSLGQSRPNCRWTVRGSYKSHSSPSASCPGLHDSQNPLSATVLLSFLSQSQGHCSRDTGLLPGKKAERVPRLKYFGQDTEKTRVVNKVSLVRVVGGAPAAGAVTFSSTLPQPSSRLQLWCLEPSSRLQLWCLELSEVSPEASIVGIPFGR